MILFFLLHPILALPVCYLCSIGSIVAFNSLWKVKPAILLRFLMFQILKTLTGSHRLSSKKVSSFIPLHALSNHSPQQKMAAFYTYLYRVLHISSDLSNLSNEIICIKYLPLFRSYNPSVIDKALNKFKKPKNSVCHSGPCLDPVVLPFYSSISFKTLKSMHVSVSKSLLELLLNKIKFSYPKDPIPIDHRSGNCFIPCSCNLSYID